MAKRKEPPPEEGAPLWMVTFSDMTCQLMTFFILLISMSTINASKFADVMGSLEVYFGSGENPVQSAEPKQPQEIIEKILESMAVDTPRGVLIENVRGMHLRVTTLRSGVRIAIGGRPLFEKDSAELSEDSKEAVREVARLVRGYRNRLRILGHSDPTEGRPLDPDGGWKLSFARALAVKDFLENPDLVGKNLDIDEKRFEVDAAARYQPSGSNQEEVDAGRIEEGKLFNRRVEIVVTEELVELD